MFNRIWTKPMIIQEIQQAARDGHDLSYSRMENHNSALVRAAEREFGSWCTAIGFAGYDYSTIRKYRQWTRERVIEKILFWHRQGKDLSWRHVSEYLDPPLAAAALQAGRFVSWDAALSAAGLSPDVICRYERWSTEKIEHALTELARQGVPLDYQTLSEKSPSLLAAIYRNHGSLTSLRETVYARIHQRHTHKAAWQD